MYSETYRERHHLNYHYQKFPDGEAMLNSTDSKLFHSSIPVVDMNDFFDPEKKQKFVNDVSIAAQKVGFFAVINPNIDMDIVQRAYSASKAFFSSPECEKRKIYKPENNGQRGFVPGETAQGAQIKDLKQYLHIGRNNNLWPESMNLQTPMENLMGTLNLLSEALQKALALSIGEKEDFFTEMTKDGEDLLRALYYPKNPSGEIPWAAQHTDIDLFTILPMATEAGLQIFHNNEWLPVEVPSGAVIINIGDKLQNLTNGFFRSALHQVVSSGANFERFSIVSFVHSKGGDSMSPTEKCIELTGGIKRYPTATSFELLVTRLRELGIASAELMEIEKKSGLLDRIKMLVDSKTAAEPVIMTHQLACKVHRESF